jgi:hypothetical protein
MPEHTIYAVKYAGSFNVYGGYLVWQWDSAAEGGRRGQARGADPHALGQRGRWLRCRPDPAGCLRTYEKLRAIASSSDRIFPGHGSSPKGSRSWCRPRAEVEAQEILSPLRFAGEDEAVAKIETLG